WKTRERYAALYAEGFRDLPEITPLGIQDDVQHAWHLYVIQLDPARLRITREAFIERLQQQQIGCSVHFIPLHLHPYYRNAWGYNPEQFPVASRAFQKMVSLPLYSKMSEMDIHRTIAAVREIVLEGRQ
ncbi:MAG TPA: DegT/DnrJ/EryC1/StrS family aminotransferase, partial [Nitrospira sp.]|nr:DegT/DnrJ/EryC1/StrS family aminotransferase [Nitrospira sp.]